MKILIYFSGVDLPAFCENPCCNNGPFLGFGHAESEDDCLLNCQVLRTEILVSFLSCTQLCSFAEHGRLLLLDVLLQPRRFELLPLLGRR